MALTRGLSGRRVDFYGRVHDKKIVSPINSIDNDRAAREEYIFLKCKESICIKIRII